MENKLSLLKGRLLIFFSALSAGIALGVFASSYWLADKYPLESRKLFSFTLLIGFVGTGGCFYLFRWLFAQLLLLTRLRRIQIIVLSVLVGTFLFFASTAQWKKPDLYINFLLPVHEFEIYIPPENAPEEIVLTWFHTSLGDVSYNDVEYQGWVKEGKKLFLSAPSKNLFLWTGRPGEKIELTFQVSGNGSASLIWDGNEEILSLNSRLVNFRRSLEVPWYASREAILFLGIIFFFIFSLSLLVLIWPNRLEWKINLEEKLGLLSGHAFGIGEWGIILSVILFSLALRVFNLDALPPHIEEYAHLNAAKRILLGEPIQNVYQRSMYIVTLPITIFFAVLGKHIWVARVVGVLFNSVAIIPLYLLMRKINRPVAILSALLYATSPWIIAMARNVREYAYYPFYFYFIIYAMIEFLESFPSKFTLSGWRKLLSSKLLSLSFLLILPIYYAQFIDPLSTFKVSLLFYIIFFLFLLGKFDFRDKWNLLLLSGAFAGLIKIGYSIIQKNSTGLDLVHPLANILKNSPGISLGYFFFNPPQQWYFDRLVVISVIGIICAWFWSVNFRKHNFMPLFFSLLYIISMLAFLFFFTLNQETRFFLHIQLWHILLVAIGFYSIWILIKLVIKNKNIRSLILIGGIFATFNLQQILLSQVDTKPGYKPITIQYHHDYEPVHAYLLENAQQKKDVLLSNYYGRYAYFVGEPEYAAIKDFSYWPAILNEYNTGWIVVNQTHYWIFEDILPLEVFSINTKKIEYIDKLGDSYLWYWTTTPSH